MMLCLDCGNTRLKWALWAGDWVDEGVLAYETLSAAREGLRPWREATRVVVSNVAGGAVAQQLQAVFGDGVSLYFLQSSEAAAGVRNGYGQPTSLGVDRWCALVGAWGLQSRACLVVSAGTATTIDTLDDQGCFLGGFILPGLDMMGRALAKGTAQLPLADGEYQAWPRKTDDAIISGAVEATVGAIERAWRRLPEAGPCLLTGGAAERLLPRLGIPCEMQSRLVLEGVRRLGAPLFE